MKEARTTKLYNGLSGRELAAVAFFHTAEQNQIEIDRLLSVVPRRNYSCLDAAFTEYSDHFASVVNFWAMEYWKKTYLLSMSLFADTGDHDERAEDWLTWHAVLSAWCERHNLDLDAAYKIAGVPPKQDIPEALIDRDKVEEWLEVFTSFMPQR